MTPKSICSHHPRVSHHGIRRIVGIPMVPDNPHRNEQLQPSFYVFLEAWNRFRNIPPNSAAELQCITIVCARFHIARIRTLFE
jgi:hypothetical protein